MRTWGGGAATLGTPILIWGSHLVGGGSGPEWAPSATVALGLCALVALRSGAVPASAKARKVLSTAGILFLLLVAWALMAVSPLFRGLAQGDWHRLVDSPVLSMDPGATVLETAKLGGLAAAFVCGLAAARNRRRLRTALVVFAGLGLVWTLWALVLRLAGPPDMRLAAPLVSPNVAAAVLGSVLGAVLAAANLAGRRRPGRLLLFALLCVPASAILLTASRSGIVLTSALLAAAAVWPALTGKGAPALHRARAPLWVGGAAAVLILVGDRILVRLASTGAVAMDRAALFQMYGEAAGQAPLFGYGFGSVPALSRMLLTPETYAAAWNVRAAHNLVIQWWLEGGIVGLGLGSGLLIVLARTLWKGLDGEDWRRLWPLAGVLAIAAAQGLTDYSAEIYSVSLGYAWFAALLFGVAVSRRRFWRAGRRMSNSPSGALSDTA